MEGVTTRASNIQKKLHLETSQSFSFSVRGIYAGWGFPRSSSYSSEAERMEKKRGEKSHSEMLWKWSVGCQHDRQLVLRQSALQRTPN